MLAADEQLGPLAKTIPKHATELRAANTQLDEAASMPLAVANSAEAREPRRRQVSDFTRTLHVAENYNNGPYSSWRLCGGHKDRTTCGVF